ncbi:PadR family transcriptional regulator [Pelagibacterium limicola]|uniref:PadR family transcriptional regulator n=1 Tax=Pelagibacterium limicola TaxID=2791022 RepID=UPI0018AFDDDF|nr:PadR family transcriptional regulator [Pelagibacterium limicola]
MNVRTLCLSILYAQEASGYEIRKMCTEGECSYFVEASFGSIYPALAKLEDEGLVTSRVEHQAGKPSKKIYAITESGRAAFVDALHEPVGEDVYRSPFLLFVRFSHLLPAELVRSRIAEKLRQMDDEIAELKEMDKELKSPPADAAPTHANDAWVLRYGIAVLELARSHLSDHMDELIASAEATERSAAAAE